MTAGAGGKPGIEGVSRLLHTVGAGVAGECSMKLGFEWKKTIFFFSLFGGLRGCGGGLRVGGPSVHVRSGVYDAGWQKGRKSGLGVGELGD